MLALKVSTVAFYRVSPDISQDKTDNTRGRVVEERSPVVTNDLLSSQIADESESRAMTKSEDRNRCINTSTLPYGEDRGSVGVMISPRDVLLPGVGHTAHRLRTENKLSMHRHEGNMG